MTKHEFELSSSTMEKLRHGFKACATARAKFTQTSYTWDNFLADVMDWGKPTMSVVENYLRLAREEQERLERYRREGDEPFSLV